MMMMMIRVELTRMERAEAASEENGRHKSS